MIFLNFGHLKHNGLKIVTSLFLAQHDYAKNLADYLSALGTYFECEGVNRTDLNFTL